MMPMSFGSSDANAGPASLRVLLVEDHPAQRSLLRKMLALLGITSVHEADCGRDAIALLHGSNFGFDLVITDLRMPNGDGLDVIRAITQDSAVRQVVLLTAADDDIVSALHSLPDEINGSRLMTVAKPMSLKQLEDIAGRTLQRRELSRENRARWPTARLDQAIRQGELLAYLEPQLDLRRGDVIGFEALVRWQHPELGLLTPDRFLPELECAGLILPLTLRMMESALATLRALRAVGYEGGMSVNFGAGCLEDSDFPLQMAALAHRAGESCENITLELTETAQVEDSMLEVSNLARLRLEGFQLAMDDFGMGYASLAKLQRGAFNEIKIDRDFTRRISSDRTSRAAVESILALARSLDVSCIAEGIEDEQTRQWLIEIGCQQGQGYFFSRAMAPTEVVGWWLEHRRKLRDAVATASPAPELAGRIPTRLDDRALSKLAKRDQPAWIFDIDYLAMVWANSAGLKFWGANDLDELRSRDFQSDMSVATRQRLRAYRQLLIGGQVIPEQWTLYPGGTPATVDCLLTGLYAEDGRASMLVEALPEGSLVNSDSYEAESARAAAVAILVVLPSGEVLWQNPAAAHAHGATLTRFAALINNAELAESLLTQALARGETDAEAEVVEREGVVRRRVAIRRARDRANGRMLMVVTLV